MDALSTLGVLMGGTWASGLNLYLTVAGLGIINRIGAIDLPGNLDILSHPLVIAAALFMTVVEFFADKIPFVDSAWDSVHTFIRPVGGALIAYMGLSDAAPALQLSSAIMGGTLAMDTHLTKATTRAAINTSPEPFTNSIASFTEDGLVVAVLWLVIRHPVIAAVLVFIFVLISIWFLKIMFRFLKNVFRALKGKPAGAPGQ
ncbi:MAG TPA: DUF4126 domain-containing protein [Candidatus Omnitrophota bacterium]|nr:DUF4126 domain-containing protein [Candidatus Omnitrophota bacterium]